MKRIGKLIFWILFWLMAWMLVNANAQTIDLTERLKQLEQRTQELERKNQTIKVEHSGTIKIEKKVNVNVTFGEREEIDPVKRTLKEIDKKIEQKKSIKHQIDRYETKLIPIKDRMKWIEVHGDTYIVYL